MSKQAYRMTFDIGTIKHLGVQMYSTLPPVIAELVSNAWDADATRVDIIIPATPINVSSEIIVKDDGSGMSDSDIRNAYLVVGRDRRKNDGDKPTPVHKRKVMGRKGIGKFSAFGVASEIEIETVQDGEASRFVMSYDELEKYADRREILLPAINPTGEVMEGTKITLRQITKYKTRSISIQTIRRGLARRFSVIGKQYKFEIYINGEAIKPEDRDLKRLLERDTNGNLYLWEFNDHEIKPDTGWKVNGWIGALDRTSPLEDGIQRGIVLMARGKLVQEPFVFEATVGQQYALSYLVGELHTEFVDAKEDTIGTTRNSLVWDTEANIALKEWGQRTVNTIARQWAEKRSADNEIILLRNPLYNAFTDEAKRFDNRRAQKIADELIRDVIQNPIASDEVTEKTIQMCINFLEFDAFQELAQDMVGADISNVDKIITLFREWEIVEAKEMMRVTEGRITTIRKLQELIESNALEVPTLHTFLKEFPWVLDPRWTLIADEKRYSQLLREQFPEQQMPDEDRRIDFLCVREGTSLIVVEIKRPQSRASLKELAQIEEYVNFMRDYIQRTSDPSLRHKDVTGYLLCGDLVDSYQVRGRQANLESAAIFVRRYNDLLAMVKASHGEFLSRYERLRRARER